MNLNNKYNTKNKIAFNRRADSSINKSKVKINKNLKIYNNKLSNLNKQRVINNISPNIKGNKGIFNKLCYIYNYICNISFFYITPSNLILIFYGALYSFYFIIIICNNIPLLLNNILVYSEITWSFNDSPLELNNIKFNYNKTIEYNEIIINSKDNITIKKNFTNNKYLTIFNFNNNIYVPSCIQKNYFFNTLSTNEIIPSRLINIPSKTNPNVFTEALIYDINPKSFKGIELQSSRLRTFSTIREYIKMINDTIVYNEKKILDDFEINMNKNTNIEKEFISLLEIDTKIKSLSNKYDEHSSHLKDIKLILKNIEHVNDNIKKNYINVENSGRSISHVYNIHGNANISNSNSDTSINNNKSNSYHINAKTVNITTNNYYSNDSD